jgi:hypothetical protein
MMSSEISTEAPGRADVAASGSAGDFHPWQLFTLVGLVGATGVVFFAKGQSPAAVILLSLAIFAAAAVGAAALHTFGPLAGLLRPDATRSVAGRTRVALEREKALVLRTIKELEFDRAMGKMSEKDFVDMSARLRARAARLIRQLDAGATYRDSIEREIERRVAPKVKTPAAAAARFCPQCGARADAAARFCAQCGAAIGATA